MNHRVKIWPELFQPLVSGEKTFEIRNNDRGYQRGDTITLRETDGHSDYYLTGQETTRLITYVHSGLGMADGYVALGLAECKEATK